MQNSTKSGAKKMQNSTKSGIKKMQKILTNYIITYKNSNYSLLIDKL